MRRLLSLEGCGDLLRTTGFWDIVDVGAIGNVLETTWEHVESRRQILEEAGGGLILRDGFRARRYVQYLDRTGLLDRGLFRFDCCF